ASAGVLLASRAVAWLSPGIVGRLEAEKPQTVIAGWMLSLTAALVASAIVGALLAIVQILYHLPIAGQALLALLRVVAIAAGVKGLEGA
ncbi:MAG: hypothetical protein AAFR52_03635, partial [Pseudomonadota bacterium]